MRITVPTFPPDVPDDRYPVSPVPAYLVFCPIQMFHDYTRGKTTRQLRYLQKYRKNGRELARKRTPRKPTPPPTRDALFELMCNSSLDVLTKK